MAGGRIGQLAAKNALHLLVPLLIIDDLGMRKLPTTAGEAAHFESMVGASRERPCGSVSRIPRCPRIARDRRRWARRIKQRRGLRLAWRLTRGGRGMAKCLSRAGVLVVVLWSAIAVGDEP